VLSSTFEEYCRVKQDAAQSAVLAPFKTVATDQRLDDLSSIGNSWTRALFDGDFYASVLPADSDIPVTNLVLVQSRDGNTGAEDPSSLGGGDTDKHVIYEGLTRLDADAVLAGATTARSDELVFSVWHPELVALRRQRGRVRHPAQVVIVSRSALNVDAGLMFQVPELRVFLITASSAAESLRLRVAARPWIEVVDAGQPLSMHVALRQLKSRGIATVSAVGGRTTARALLREGLVHDLYLTTAAKNGGEPGTPLLQGPLDARTVVIKEGTGPDAGVRFVHYVVGRLKAAPTS